MYICNKPKLAPLALLLTVILTGCNDNKTSAEYVEEAKSALEVGQQSVAIISLKNSLKTDANNAEARFLLGSVYAEQGLWVNAGKELLRAVKTGYAKDKLYALLAKVHYNEGDSVAIEELLTGSDSYRDITLLEIKAFLAMAYLKENDIPRTEAALSDLLKSKVETKFTQLGQAIQFWLKEDNKKALEIITQVLDHNPKFSEALEYQAYFLSNEQRHEESAESFDLYLKIHPQASQIRLKYMMALAEAANFTEAETQADLLMAISSNNPLVNQVKSQCRLIENDFIEAKHFAEIALRTQNDLLIANIVAGYSAYKIGQLELAYNYLTKVKSKLTLQHPARKLLIALSIELGYGEEAYEELSKAPTGKSDSNVLMYTASELIKVGGFKQAEELMLKANELEPENSAIVYQRGIMKLLSGDSLAVDLFDKMLKINPDSNIAVAMLVISLLEEGDFTQALQLTNKIKESNPQLSYSLLGGINNKRGDLDKAEEAFLHVISLNPNHLAALYNLAKINEHRNSNKTAVSYYQRMLSADNQHMPAILGLLKLAKDPILSSSIESIFQKNLANNPKDSIANFAMVEFFISTVNLNDAKKVIETGLSQLPNDVKLLVSRANIEAYEKDYNSSLATLNMVLSIDPKAFGVHLSKSKIYLAMGDLNLAISEQEKVVEMKPGVLTFKVGLAELYLQNSNIVKVKSLIEKLTDKDKSAVRIIELQGQIALAEKNYQQAARAFEDVYNQQPSERVLLSLIGSLQRIGLEEKALKLINDIKEDDKALPLKLVLKQAELYSILHPKKAINLYKELAKKTNNHYVILNNLAMLYLQQGENQEALVVATQAMQAEPNTTAIQDTYGLALLNMNENKRALEILENVYKSSPGSLNYSLHYAQALMANNKAVEAKELIEKIDESLLGQQDQLKYQKLKELL